MGPETRISQEPPAHTLTDEQAYKLIASGVEPGLIADAILLADELHGTVHYEPSLTTDDGSSTNNQ